MRTRPAMGASGVRWYWAVREHQPYHNGCKQLSGGLCGFKMIRYEFWNEGTGKWELLPIENAATPEQITVLESH